MFKKLFATLVSAIILAGNSYAQPSLGLMPSSSIVDVGKLFNIDVVISGLGGQDLAVGVFDLDVVFEESRVTFQDVYWGYGLDVLRLGSFQLATKSIGSVNLLELSLDTADDLNQLQSPEFALAKLTFIGERPGTASFSIFVNALGNAVGNDLFFSLAGPIEIKFLAPVPEPESYLLITVGLFMVYRILKMKVAA